LRFDFPVQTAIGPSVSNPVHHKRIAAASFVVLAAVSLMASSRISAEPKHDLHSRSGLDLSAIDRSVKPGDDFFNYAVGTWYAHNEIPPDRSEIGIEVDTSEKVEGQLKSLIEESARSPQNADEERIAALYRSYMDEKQLEAVDDHPLQADLARIAAINDRSAFAFFLGESHSGFGADAFSLLVQPDAHRPINTLFLGQGGLGLPDRDYYISRDLLARRTAYVAYAARLLQIVGFASPEDSAKAAIAFETRIAEASWPQADQRDVEKTYNPMSIAELQAYAPEFDWASYLKGAHTPGLPSIVLAEKSAVRKIAQIVAETPLDTLKAWEMFRTVDNASPFLSRRFVDARFAFRNHDLFGESAMLLRWKRAVGQVNNNLGDAVGREYVARYFPPTSRARIESMVQELKRAMAARIARARWMSARTRQEALDKLAHMKVFVGYPDEWRNYSGLQLSPVDLYGNVRRSAAFDWAYQIAMIGKPVKPKGWGPFNWTIHPQTVDAFNIASENKIIFPAALLQPPQFDPAADPAVNYGIIGAVIGHEISHGFDDQGRKMDASGTLRDWWTAEDAAHYRAEADKLARQVDAYEILPGVHLNGHQTLGENIADVAGITLALNAYHASLHGKPAPVIDGFTGDQRVFLAWGQKWRRKNRDDALRARAAADRHAPARFRAIGSVRNVDAWYRAFSVKPGDRYYLPPGDRARIW
jgi:putative endopeptidase